MGELMSIRDVEGIDLPDGNTGEGLKFTTNRGDFKAILHRAPDTDKRSEERRVGKECRSRWSPYH